MEAMADPIEDPEPENCPICMDDLDHTTVRIQVCG